MGSLMQNSTLATGPTPVSNDTVFEDLKKLGELKSLGVVTEEEFNEKKKELLSKIR
jgi:hypothetical protein